MVDLVHLIILFLLDFIHHLLKFIFDFTPNNIHKKANSQLRS
jgi:hypothetical protein